MANISGASNALPGAYTDVETQSNGVSVPGGTRLAAIIGEGLRSEIIVSSALGSGQDGLDPTFTTTTGSDGRHFTLSLAPVVSNRTTLYRNGIPLKGTEQSLPSVSTLNNRFDYRIDIVNGLIELQTAHLVDLGGFNYLVKSTNTGVGTIANLTLTDINAPTETWTIKCVTVQRDSGNVPIAATAKFIAFGSVSGVKLDSLGNPVTWRAADTALTTNGVLSFSITETSTFVEGDTFTIKVSSGVLIKNDSLTINYIATTDLNDPTLFTSMSDVVQKHGLVSTSNALSLGCQLAFANQTPGVYTVQAAPSVPRRTSYLLDPAVNLHGSSDDNEYIFPLPLGVTPDANADIHFFIKNPATGVETQILPNKFPFYTVGTGGGNPTNNAFINSATLPSGGNKFSYSVIQSNYTLNSLSDGVITPSATTYYQATLHSPSVTFDASYVGLSVLVVDSNYLTNNSYDPVGAVDTLFTVNAVVNGDLIIQRANSVPHFTQFIAGTAITFQLLDSTDTVVSAFSAADGVIASPASDTATFTSASALFGAVSPAITSSSGHKIKITTAASATNIGTWKITAISTNTVTIKRGFQADTAVQFEVVDTGSSSVTTSVIVNKFVVPATYALRATIVDSKDASFYDAGWVAALASLEVLDVDIVVPLPRQTISTIFQNTISHCRAMSNVKNRKERVAFVGAIKGLTPDAVNGVKNVAVEDIGVLEGIQGDDVAEVLAGNTEDLANYSVTAAFGTTFRAMYFYPDEIVVQAGASNVKVDGFYIAAAAAGYLSGITNIAIPLTNKVLSGFSILKTKQFKQLVLEQLTANGITVVQPVSGGGRVIWGKTTTQSGFPEEEEISIIFIRDRVAKNLRAGFAGFVGEAESDILHEALIARAVGLANSFIGQGLITAFADLSVKRDSVDPRQWNVSMRVQPVYPVNWIYIKVGVGLI